MRKLKIKWTEIEVAADSSASGSVAHLDRETGAVFIVSDETADELQELLPEADASGAAVEEAIAHSALPAWQQDALREAWHVEQHLGERMVTLADLDLRDDHRDLADFAAAVADAAVRRQLEEAMRGRGGFRRFRDVIHGTFRERQQWFAFQAQRRREKATAWLAAHGVSVEWIIPEPVSPHPPPRQHLLAGVLNFVRTATKLPGVNRVALLGSLTREEPEPKDADVLVTVMDDANLTTLAAAGRKLAGHAQQLNRSGDVFLADKRGSYLGRTCPWRECGPVRARCDALHCGQRPHLHDDLHVVTLASKLITAPPIELWPTVQARVPVPPDVERVLLRPLREGSKA